MLVSGSALCSVAEILLVRVRRYFTLLLVTLKKDNKIFKNIIWIESSVIALQYKIVYRTIASISVPQNQSGKHLLFSRWKPLVQGDDYCLGK